MLECLSCLIFAYRWSVLDTGIFICWVFFFVEWNFIVFLRKKNLWPVVLSFLMMSPVKHLKNIYYKTSLIWSILFYFPESLGFILFIIERFSIPFNHEGWTPASADPIWPLKTSHTDVVSEVCSCATEICTLHVS